jgi:hypothetical protein
MANRPQSIFIRAAGTGLEPGAHRSLNLDLEELTVKATPVLADSVALIDSEAANVSKVATLTSIQSVIGGAGGVGSIFVVYNEFDAGVTTAVDFKLTDSLQYAGQLVAAYAIVTELFNGTADSTVIVSKAATGATPMCSNMVMDNGSSQGLGSMMGGYPVTGANSIQAAAGDVYAYVAADGTRNSGKLGFLLIFERT